MSISSKLLFAELFVAELPTFYHTSYNSDADMRQSWLVLLFVTKTEVARR